MAEFQQEIEQLKQLLQTTYQGTSTEQVKHAEQELQKVSHHQDFLKYLVYIMKDGANPLLMQKSASNYVHIYVRNIYNKPNQQGQSQQIQEITEQIILAMRDSTISLDCKHNIAKGLSIILSLDRQNETKLKLFQLAQSWIPQDDISQLASTFIILQTVVVSTQQKDFLLQFFSLLNIPFCQVGSKYLQEITSSLQLLDKSQNEQETVQIFQKTIEGIKVLNLWAIVLKDLVLQVMDSRKKQLISCVIENEILANLICHGICVTLNTPQQIKDCLICTSGKKEFDDAANTLKSHLIKTYTRINRQMFNERSKFDIFKTQFFKLLEQSLPIILKGLMLFCQQTPDFQDKLENQALSSIVIECLKFSHICAEQSEFYKIFQDCSRVLLLEVIFPLMRSSQSEQESLENNPEEFVRLALDTCDRQISYSYKCAAAKLLETVCDYIDGFETIVSLLLIQIVGFSIKFENITDVDANYPNLTPFKETVFMSKTERHIRIETCFVALSVLSYLTPKRPDIVGQIELLLREHAQFLFNHNIHRLIKVRVCLMLGYYTDSVFQNEKENYKSLIQFLLSCLTLKEQEDQGIVYQAIDSLQNIYDDDNQVALVGENINEVLQVILPLITTTEFHQFMDIIFHIFRYHSKNISTQNVINCVGYLVKRIIDEVKLIEDKLRPDQIYINKCWNIIRDMSENKFIVPQYIDHILEQLRPLLQCVQYPDKIEFDEDIILLVGSFIYHQKAVNPICSDLITCFPLILKKQSYVFAQLFKTLNNVIIYGQQFLIQNVNHLQLIIKMAYDTMFSDSHKSSDSDKAEGAAILQLIIQSLGNNLTDEMWKVIFNAAIQRFQNQTKLRHNFAYGRTAGIFLSGFNSNILKTTEILTEMGILEQVIDLCVNKLDMYKRNYDIKLFILSMSKVIVQVSLDANKVLKIFDCLISLMMKQKELEQKLEKKRKLKDDDNNNNSDDEGDDDDEEDDDDDDEDDDEEIEDDNDDNDLNANNYDREYDCSVSADKLMLKEMVTPINQEDEFTIFKHSYSTMKTQNFAALQQLVYGLNQEKQKYLAQLLSVQRVNVGDEQVIRVIRQIKRKTQQQPPQ
ncbi:hypothetical protein ABPG73_018224 [Tetrahymena malaccensis]